ncbi:ATP-binding protein [Leptolyngbya iicbica]|jgi:Cdc6-like AAA superfamily ATPase|uniref:ATP-binding protein n=2 Tax=Cyanophyceae TaxID=3028117 RepID=A0A4Q7E9B2_9CYAN|nr:ATP-binding protein [Leptolyngbya sp. LK]RZM79083.1 ATP-binding protein [Leptolyngbya sp. LK]
MKERYIDPFTPDLPIDSSDRFSGRIKEIDSVIDSLFQLANDKPKHTIITGDRGIGKSSVLIQARNLAEGNLDLAERLGISPGLDNYNFVCAWHDCATDQTPSALASGILSQLQTSLENLFGKLKIELNIGGILTVGQKEDSSVSSLSEVVELFCAGLARAANQAKDKGKSGIVLFFDELDRVETSSGVATFFKLSAEKLSRDQVKSVAFFAAGITGAIQNLEEEHGSIYRTFKDVPLPRLELLEVEQILKEGFNSVACTYENEVIQKIFELCAGYPEPVHLLGSQILKSDSDDHLSADDFEVAKVDVVETLRRNKLASMLRKAGSGKYQKILEAMASYGGANVPLTHITQTIGYEQNQYSANMGNLLKRDIISSVDRGVYCFVDPLLKEYIARFGVINTEDENNSETEL